MRIALLGDIALIGRYDKILTQDVNRRVEAVRRLVSDCDFVIANLESPLTSVTKTWACKGVYLRSDPINVETLKYLGVTHVTLANNHIYDYGKRGAKETVDVLRRAGIQYVGLNNGPELLSDGESSVMLEGFCCLSANALNYGDVPGQVRMLTYESMNEFLAYAHGQGSLPIASVHFGLEGLHYPSVEHVNLFRSLADEYAYVLHGNHPHAIQGYEMRGESLLVYAQGNLCFDKTPVTSIRAIPQEKPEERKCYIVVLDVKGNRVASCLAFEMTDLDTGALHESPRVGEELKQYVEALAEPVEELARLREKELSVQKACASKRDLRFFLNRMNRKYIGAYLNGRRNARQYAAIIGLYGEQ